MWGLADNACPLCDAPYSLCDCADQLLAINKDLKSIRDTLIKRARVTNQDYVSPEFLTRLREQGDAPDELVKSLAVEIPEQVVLNAFLNGSITNEQYMQILRVCDTAKESWVVRSWRKLWRY